MDERTQRDAVNILLAIGRVPEARRLDALALALRVWIAVPSLRVADIPWGRLPIGSLS